MGFATDRLGVLEALPTFQGVRRRVREHGLTLAFFALFAASLVGQTLAGHRTCNEEQREHGQEQVSYGAYLTSAHFLEATSENWESEFLQMAAYVLLTAWLFQRGSAESKTPDGPEEVDDDPRLKRSEPGVPRPVKRGGLALKLYEHSLSLALLAVFLASFFVHAASGAREYSEDQLAHGGRRCRCSPTSPPAASGSSRSRTGRASSSRSSRWWCSRSSCASGDRPSPSRWRPRTGARVSSG